MFASTCAYFPFFGLCTGAIAIAMEYILFTGKCMQTRRNYLCFDIVFRNRICLPLHLIMFHVVVCRLEQ